MMRPAILVTAILLAGCGQKGPLYLPDQPRDIVTRPAPASPPADAKSPEETAPEESKDKDKKDEPPR